MLKDHYATLGVSATSDHVAIRAAFKALMRRYHPDTNRAPDAHGRAAEINEAFAVLGDARKRAIYDAQRKAADPLVPPPRPPPPPQAPRPPVAAKRLVVAKQAKAASQARRAALIVGTAVLAVAVVAVVERQPRVSAAASLDDEGPFRTDRAADRAVRWSVEGPRDDGAEIDTALVNLASFDIALGPQPTTLRLGDIAATVGAFHKELRRNGLAGARSWSLTCHDEARRAPSWAAADRCAAFDFAANATDRERTEAAGARPNAYFAFQAGNQADYYLAMDGTLDLVNERLARIRGAVEPMIAGTGTGSTGGRERRMAAVDRTDPASRPASD